MTDKAAYQTLPLPLAPSAMMPVKAIFERMSRLIRELCESTAKEIHLTIDGGDTEMDKSAAEALVLPLAHMVMNAVDHGIEPGEARDLTGKFRAGRIHLRAYHQAGMVVIEVSDDGRGLRKEKIIQKAVEAGIIRPDEQLTEQEVFNLIFHPGLSTADRMSGFSGLGDGMEIVRKNVHALRGRIEINSVERVGTTFTLRLPLTVIATDGLIDLGPAAKAA